MTIGLQEGMQGLGVAAKIAAVVFQTEILDVLVGIVQYRVEMAAQIGQIVVNWGQLLLEHTAHLAGRVGGGIGGVRLNQIDNGFCLSQIQLAVQEGPFGVFAPLGGLGSGNIQRFQPCRQHSRGAVTVKFHRVLTGIGMGTPGNHSHALVNGAALFVVKLAEHELPVRDIQQGFLIVQGKYLIRDGNAVVTRQTDDADGADLIARGYGGDGVRHGLDSFDNFQNLQL